MTYLHPVAAVPNNLITDANLSYTTKRVAFVLLLLAGRKGQYVTASFAALARLCKCSTTTAQKAVKELCAQGYLTLPYPKSRKNNAKLTPSKTDSLSEYPEKLENPPFSR